MLGFGVLFIVGVVTLVVGLMYVVSADDGRRYWRRAQSGVKSNGAGPFREVAVPTYYRHSPVAVRRAAFASMWFGAIFFAGAVVGLPLAIYVGYIYGFEAPQQQWLALLALLLAVLAFIAGASLFNTGLDLVYRTAQTARRAERATNTAFVNHFAFLATTVLLPFGVDVSADHWNEWLLYLAMSLGFLTLALLHARWLRRVVDSQRHHLDGENR